MVVYEVGSLFEVEAPVVAHGVNACGVFGAGVARLMAERWPEAKEAYLRAFRAGRARPGDVIWCAAGGRAVAHCVTQPTYGRNGVHVDYAAVERCMAALASAAAAGVPGMPGLERGFGRVAMPKIGAGLGGGDWSRIEAIVARALADVEVVVAVLAPGEIPRPAGPGAGRRG